MTARLHLVPPQSHADAPAAAPSIPIEPVSPAGLDAWCDAQPEATRRWVRACGFTAGTGEFCLLPDADGGLARVVFGRPGAADARSMWDFAALPAALPDAVYRIDAALPAADAERAALSWALATYRFERYRSRPGRFPRLIVSDGADHAAVERTATAVFLARDLINTPAEDLGPPELAEVATGLGARFGAQVHVLSGEDLVAHNYPAIHAVGRAGSRPPCLIDLRWGEADAPRLTLVGKGVCFDTGGLDIKPAAAMKLMKKDMGGAAVTLALAQMVMDARLPVRLRLLVPAVENSISASALRPLDVVRTRKGPSVEIGNTDAEGRVILADALAEAASEHPELTIDCATLTGAARMALGTELPALFCNDDATAAALLECAAEVEDPMWRLPLWRGYRRHVEGKTAALTNAPAYAYAGAITAALFLQEFVAAERSWVHLDMMAWNLDNQPGRGEGGEAQGLRALFHYLRKRFA
jgi:leucyl aminopeptidase